MLDRASSVEEVFSVLGDSEQPRHLCQAVASLWTLHRTQGALADRPARPLVPDFQRLVATLLERADSCDHMGLVSAVYCLGRLDVMGHDVGSAVSQLAMGCVWRLADLSLADLGRLAAGLHRRTDWPPPLVGPYLRRFVSHMAACDSWRQLRLLSGAFLYCRRYLSDETEGRFAALVHHHLKHSAAAPDTGHTLLQLLQVLGRRGLHRQVEPISQDLLSLYARTEKRPSAAAVARLGATVTAYHQVSPAVERLLAVRAADLLHADTHWGWQDLWLMSTAFPHASLRPAWVHRKLLQSVREELASLDQTLTASGPPEIRSRFVHDLSFIDRVLRELRPMRRAETQQFLALCLQVLNEAPQAGDSADRLARFLSYVYFTHATKSAVSSSALEAALCDRLQRQLRDFRVVEASRVVHLLAFLLAFSECALPADLLSRLVALVERDQMTATRSRRLSQAIRLGNRRARAMAEPNSHSYLHQLTQLNIGLNNWTLRHLPALTSIGVTASLVQGIIQRSGVVRGNTAVLDAVMTRLKELTAAPQLCSDSLRSHAVGILSVGLGYLRYRDPDVIRQLCRHVVQHRDHVTGLAVEPVLSMVFSTGYWPLDDSELENFLATSAGIISRSVYRMPAEKTLRACQALCLYGELPVGLARTVLSQAFLDQTEREIRQSTANDGASGAKRHHRTNRAGHRLRFLQMEVNRAIRLNLPDENMPWFSGVYAQGLPDLQMDAGSRRLVAAVHDQLVQLVGGSHLVHRGVRTAGYHFSAELVVHRRPDGSYTNTEGPMVTSIALLVPSTSDYCINTPHLVGAQLLRKRHLEILGFTVRFVHPHHWNSMALAEPANKHAFLAALMDGRNLLDGDS